MIFIPKPFQAQGQQRFNVEAIKAGTLFMCHYFINGTKYDCLGLIVSVIYDRKFRVTGFDFVESYSGTKNMAHNIYAFCILQTINITKTVKVSKE